MKHHFITNVLKYRNWKSNVGFIAIIVLASVSFEKIQRSYKVMYSGNRNKLVQIR